MPQPPMTIGQATQSPDSIIYETMSRIINERSNGMGGVQALEAAQACIDHWKDREYEKEMERLASLPDTTDADELFWGSYRAIVRLLERKNKWAHSPRTVKEGEEFLEAI